MERDSDEVPPPFQIFVLHGFIAGFVKLTQNLGNCEQIEAITNQFNIIIACGALFSR
jgi:hypothetical protein